MQLFNFPGDGNKTVEVPHGLEHFTGDLNIGISALHKVAFKNGGKGQLRIFLYAVYIHTQEQQDLYVGAQGIAF